MWTLARKGLLFAIIPTVFNIVILIAVGAFVRMAVREREREIAAREIMASSNRLLTLLVDAETGMRGYALTADRKFAEPYVWAVASYQRELERLDQANDKPGALTLKRGAEEVMGYETGMVRQLDLAARADVVRIIASGEGKRKMDAFRQAVAKFQETQRRESEQRARSAVHAERLLMAIVVGGVMGKILLVVVLSSFFTRNITRRLMVVVENTRRFEMGEPLLDAQPQGVDEIAVLDSRFHHMAVAVTATRDELESFSYSVSHDLRAPIRAINGFSRLLQNDYGSMLQGDGARYVGIIRSEAERMGALIDDLLAFSRMGKATLRKSSVDMDALFRSVASELLRQQPDASLTIEPLPPAIGDASLLRQVAANLVGNALKFTNGEPARVSITGSRHNGLNRYVVADHGVGFDMRYVDKLFGVFQRLHTGEQFEGTGVGLAIVKRIVNRHGGDIDAEGEPGRGARFTFTLPADPGGGGQ